MNQFAILFENRLPSSGFQNNSFTQMDSYPGYAWKDMPEDFDRQMHNEWGRRLAKQIKSYLPPEIKMRLFIINAEDERNFRRNVNQEEINQ